MSAKGRRKTDDDLERLAGDVHEALRSLGWVAPTCEADVRRAEQALAAEPVELPESLRDARQVFEQHDRRASAGEALLTFPCAADIDATLARAAREDGPVTPEIEQRMRRDRQAAERESDHAEDDS